MYIEKIHIDTFGMLNDLDIELDAGMNIIKGNNESGKSTIAAFIKFILYGIPQKERDSVVSWQTGGAAGSLTVKTADKTYRVERAITSNREAVQLVDCETNMPVRGAFKSTTPGEFLLSVDADMFEATAFVSQLGSSAPSGAKVSEGIENILFSADEGVNTQRALSKLDSARKAILHKNEKGGRLAEIDTACAALELRLADAVKTHDAILETEAKLEDTKAKLDATKAKAAHIGGKVEQFETKTLLKLFERGRELEECVAQLRAEIERTSSAELSEIEALEALRTRVIKIEEEILQLKTREEELSSQGEDPVVQEYIASGGRATIEGKLKLFKRSAAVCAAIGVAAFVGGIAAVVAGILPAMTAGEPKLVPLIGGGVLTVLAIVLFVTAVILKKRGDGIEANYDFDVLDEEVARYESKKEACKQTVSAREDAERRYSEVCDEVMNTHGCTPRGLDEKIAEYNEKFRASDGIKAEYDKNYSLLSQIRTQLDQYSENELTEKLDEGIDISDIDSSNLPAMRREAEFAAKAAESLEKLESELEVLLAGLMPSAEDPTVLNDKLAAMKHERSELAKKHAAYKLAYEKLCEASETVRSSVAPRLAADAAQLMAHVTNGKYRSLGVGAELGMSAETVGGQKPIDVLSAGTQDAAYLCLRFSLISLLYRDSVPPMVFDESFVKQDDERLINMLKLIKFREAQSIIFTSNDREIQLVKALGGCNVIEL